MKIYIVGIGLIGGMMDWTSNAVPKSYRLWVDSNENHLQEALTLGVIDETAILENVRCRFCNRFCSCGCSANGVA
jgi:prephenate dehydrogenase